MNHMLPWMRNVARAFFLLFAFFSNAHALLPCAKKWTGPDANNDFAKCDLGSWVVKKSMYLFAPFALFLLVFFILKMTVSGRYLLGCCGSYRRRPGHICYGGEEWDERTDEEKERKYSKTEVSTVKYSVVVVAFVSLISMILMVVGVHRLGVAYNDVWSDMTGLVDWGHGKVKVFRTALDLRGGMLEGVLDQKQIDKVMKDLDMEVETFKTNVGTFRSENVDKIWKPISTIGYVLAFVPLVFFITAILLAFCNIRTGGPIALIFFLWVLGICLCLVALLLSALHGFFSEADEELNAQTARQPGIFQWYIVPNCLSLRVFDEARDLILQSEELASLKVCSLMALICDKSDTYDGRSPNKVFKCPYENDHAQCSTISGVLDALTNKTTPKKGVAGGMCKHVPDNQCTWRVCAKECSDPDIASAAANVLATLDAVDNMMRTLKREIIPYLDCNAIVDQVLTLLAQVPVFKKGSVLLAVGAYIYSAAAIAMIILMLLGQKRFFSRSVNNDSYYQSSFVTLNETFQF